MGNESALASSADNCLAALSSQRMQSSHGTDKVGADAGYKVSNGGCLQFEDPPRFLNDLKIVGIEGGVAAQSSPPQWSSSDLMRSISVSSCLISRRHLSLFSKPTTAS